jgi:hypothetical protein
MARTKSIVFPNTESELSALFDKLQRAITNKLLVSGALAIHGSASALAKTAATAYYMIDGQLYSKAAADMPALVGTVTNAKFNVFVFTANAAGTLKSYTGTQAATLGGVVFPTVADGEASLGFIIVNPTGTGDFVGGTTALDDATVVPGVVYVNSGEGLQAQFATI